MVRSLWVVWLCACGAAAPFSPIAATRIDDAAARELASGAVAGVSVAVGRGGDVVFARGWGVAALELDTPAGPRTRYRIQSVSKLITAVAVLKLVEEGRVALTDPITRWFPRLPAGVTVAHLLTHTSGLADFWKLDVYQRAPPERPRDVVSLVAAAQPSFAPGSRFAYAHTNFLLLGLVVERVTGRKLADVLRDVVFRPAGMTESGLDCGAIATRGYVIKDKGFALAPRLVVPPGEGSASICASAPDLARFAQALVGGRLLRPDTVAAMLTPQKLADGRTIPFGLGADLEPFDGRPVFGHPGAGAGFNARVTHFRDEGVTVVVLANTAGDAVSRLRFQAGRAARGVPDPGGEPRLLPAALRTALVGDWQFEHFVLHVYDSEGALWARLTDPVGERLVYLGEGVFGGADQPNLRLVLAGNELTMDYYGVALKAHR